MGKHECFVAKVYLNKKQLPYGTIYWTEAKDHIGETVSICGDVTSTYFDYKDIELHPTLYLMGAVPPPTFIEVGERYPSKNMVKIVIWGRDRGKFQEPPDKTFENKTIIFTGKPYLYNGIVTVKVAGPSRIWIVDPDDVYEFVEDEGVELEDSDYVLLDDGYIEVTDEEPIVSEMLV